MAKERDSYKSIDIRPPLEDLLYRRLGQSAHAALSGTGVGIKRANAMCQAAYGMSFSDKRAELVEAAKETKRRNRFWRGLRATSRSTRTHSDDARPLTSRLNAR